MASANAEARELEQALEASREQARLDALGEDELIELAIQRSLAEEGAETASKDGAKGKRRAEDASSEQVSVKKAKAHGADSPPPGKINAFDVLRNKSMPKVSSSSSREPILAPEISSSSFVDASAGKPIDKLNGSLNLVFWKGWLKEPARTQLRRWMLEELSWHRVSVERHRVCSYICSQSTTLQVVYTRPNGITIRTPRFTTTFGRDDDPSNADHTYARRPKSIPPCLDALRREVERITGTSYNALIVNYYSSGDDSISYHADDETFLGKNPSIASRESRPASL